MANKVLYITYDGLSDPLGQSQVLSYLIPLAKKDVRITILSFEKNLEKSVIESIQSLLKSHGIEWAFLPYTKRPPILATIYDILQQRKKVKSLHSSNQFSIVHTRSYIAAFAGMYLKKKYGVPFVFDMRGFYADERVDGNLWPQSNPAFRMVYKYFKRKELEFLKFSDNIISLTHTGKTIIQGWLSEIGISRDIEVIPCCTDTTVFSDLNIDLKLKSEIIREHGMDVSDLIVSYVGSVGTWYMLPEMMDFFARLKEKHKTAKFLFISKDSKEDIHRVAASKGIEIESVIVIPGSREKMATLISLSSFSLFFIKPVFSKKASSPTKLAEIFALGVPVICNGNVGDLDNLLNDFPGCILVQSFNDQSYAEAISGINKLMTADKEEIRNFAIDNFDLSMGVERYYSVYRNILMKKATI